MSQYHHIWQIEIIVTSISCVHHPNKNWTCFSNIDLGHLCNDPLIILTNRHGRQNFPAAGRAQRPGRRNPAWNLERKDVGIAYVFNFGTSTELTHAKSKNHAGCLQCFSHFVSSTMMQHSKALFASNREQHVCSVSTNTALPFSKGQLRHLCNQKKSSNIFTAWFMTGNHEEFCKHDRSKVGTLICKKAT